MHHIHLSDGSRSTVFYESRKRYLGLGAPGQIIQDIRNKTGILFTHCCGFEKKKRFSEVLCFMDCIHRTTCFNSR